MVQKQYLIKQARKLTRTNTRLLGGLTWGAPRIILAEWYRNVSRVTYFLFTPCGRLPEAEAEEALSFFLDLVMLANR